MFFREKTGGFGGMRGGHSLGKPRRVGKEQRAEMEERVGMAFFKTERDDPNQHKAPAPFGAGVMLSQLK